MTEVPEHLLARSQARRAALSGEPAAAAPAAAAGGGEVEPAGSAAPAPAAPAAPAVSTPKAPEPLPRYVQAAVSRKKIPYWAMSVLAFLPFWGILYAQTLSAPPPSEDTQLVVGAGLYSTCASCHGGNGGGGSGRQLNACEVVKTFPYIEQQLEFVRLGSNGFLDQPYGDPDREGGAHVGGAFGLMPAFGSLSDEELLSVVRHERETLAGEELASDQIGPAEERLWPNGEPMLDASGTLVDPEGNPLFDAEGRLANPTLSADAGFEPAVCAG